MTNPLAKFTIMNIAEHLISTKKQKILEQAEGIIQQIKHRVDLRLTDPPKWILMPMDITVYKENLELLKQNDFKVYEITVSGVDSYFTTQTAICWDVENFEEEVFNPYKQARDRTVQLSYRNLL